MINMNVFILSLAAVLIVVVAIVNIRSYLREQAPITRAIIDQWKSERARGLTDKKLSEFVFDKTKMMIKLAMDMKSGCHDQCHDDECDIQLIYGERVVVGMHECHKPGCRGDRNVSH